MPASAVKREGKRAPLNLKTTPQLRAQLEQAAETTGRTLSQEIEARLERSFETDQLVIALVGNSSHSQNLLRSISKTLAGIEELTGYNWTEDYQTLFMCRKAVSRIMTFVLGSDRGEIEALGNAGTRGDEVGELIKNAEDLGDEALRDLGLLIPPPPSGKTTDLPRRVEQANWIRQASGRS